MKLIATDSKLYGLTKVLHLLLRSYTADDDIVIRFSRKNFEYSVRVFPEDEIWFDGDYVVVKTIVDGYPDFEVIECEMFEIVRVLRVGGN